MLGRFARRRRKRRIGRREALGQALGALVSVWEHICDVADVARYNDNRGHLTTGWHNA
jgi:hypothetical protein